jgi:raffinose/stachyose/melibiose transport system substrate-binding protein
MKTFSDTSIKEPYMNKPKFLSVITLLFLLLITGTVMNAQAEVVTVTWAMEWADENTIGPIREYIIDPFEAAHPNIRIEIQNVGASELDTVMRAQLAAGSGPDIFNTNGPAYAQFYAEAGHALNLDPYSELYDWENKILPFAYSVSQFDGSLYSLPGSYEGLRLWYNVDLFAENGWQPPTTYQEMLDLCAAIHAAGLICFASGAGDAVGYWSFWTSYMFSAGLGPELYYDVATGNVPWTDERVANAVQLLKNIWDPGYITDKEISTVSYADSWVLFASGQAAMRMDGSWGFSFVDRYVEDFEYAVVPLPGWVEGVETVAPVGIGESIVINAATEHPDEAAIVFDWMVSDPAYLGTWAGKILVSFVPTVALEREDFAPDTPPLVVDTLLSFIDEMSSGATTYATWTGLPGQTDSYIYTSIEDTLNGTISIEDFLAGAQRIFEQDVADGNIPQLPEPLRSS